jgi:hypothetical protein
MQEKFLTDTGNIQATIRANRILATAMITGVSFFTLVSLVMTINYSSPKELWPLLFIIAAALGAISFAIAFTMYRKKMQQAGNGNLTLFQRLEIHRTALIVYLALCEVPALAATGAVFITGRRELVIVTICMLAAMMLKFPSKEKLVNDLKLNWQEEQGL